VTIELKPAQFSHYPTIAKIHAQSWQNNYRNILSTQFLDEKVEKERLDFWQKRFLSSSANQQLTVAMINQNIVGFSCLNLDDDPEHGSLLDNLHILQNFQNSGIGKRLIQNCAVTILEKAKTAKMYLWVYGVNENARKVYEHLGASHLHTIEKFIEDGSKARVCKYLWEDVSSLL
jgi:ribosomal protein S18 acetylase RimI-like enzyme